VSRDYNKYIVIRELAGRRTCGGLKTKVFVSSALRAGAAVQRPSTFSRFQVITVAWAGRTIEVYIMRYGSGFCAAAAAAPCQFNYKRFEVVGEGEDLRLEKLSRFIRAAASSAFIVHTVVLIGHLQRAAPAL